MNNFASDNMLSPSQEEQQSPAEQNSDTQNIQKQLGKPKRKALFNETKNQKNNGIEIKQANTLEYLGFNKSSNLQADKVVLQQDKICVMSEIDANIFQNGRKKET